MEEFTYHYKKTCSYRHPKSIGNGGKKTSIIEHFLEFTENHEAVNKLVDYKSC